MGYPPVPVAAGQDLTANQLNAISRFVTTMTTSAVSNSTSETIIGTVTIPATDPGLALNGGYELHFFGNASDTGTPTLEIRVRLSSVTGTVLYDSTAITCRSSVSGMTAHVCFRMMITSAGSSGTADGYGFMVSTLNATSAAITPSAVTGVTVNTTAAITLVVTAKWSAASTSNTMTGDVGSLDRI